MNEKTLNYVLVNPGADITLDLFEAERYAAAVVVQPLVGNLVSIRTMDGTNQDLRAIGFERSRMFGSSSFGMVSIVRTANR